MWNSGLKLVKKVPVHISNGTLCGMYNMHITFPERKEVVRTKKTVNTRLSEVVGTVTTSNTGKFR